MNATIEHNFSFHPPTDTNQARHAVIREKAKELANYIDAALPAEAGREKATAITKLEEAMFWACAGLLRH